MQHANTSGVDVIEVVSKKDKVKPIIKRFANALREFEKKEQQQQEPIKKIEQVKPKQEELKPVNKDIELGNKEKYLYGNLLYSGD